MTDPSPPIALEDRAEDADRLFSPSAARNRAAIADAFVAMVGGTGAVLEIGSGTGEHGAYLTGQQTGLHWTPSDPDERSRRSVAAWAQTVPDGRMTPPRAIDATMPEWWTGDDLPTQLTAVVSINMIHIAPPAAMEGLIRGAAHLLPAGGHLFLYGPFLRDGVSAESNHAFDADLKRRDPRWGVRDLDREVAPFATGQGFALSEVRAMPANNLSVLFTLETPQ